MSGLSQQRSKPDSDSTSYQIDVSDDVTDPSWDYFLSSLGSNHHLQSSLWAQAKSFNGWTAKRIVASRNGDIVGGAQMLIRNVRYVGPVGYVPKGPILGEGNDDVAPELLARIREIANANRIRVLFVQPPEQGPIAESLADQGFRPCPVETAPTATILVDVSDDLDCVLGRMPKGMRNQIRRSQKRGIQVREGSRADLPTFHGLLSATSQRRGFSTFELEYFQRMWDVFAASDGIKLFIAELDGEAVSAQFCVPFGDTVIAKQIGWSGDHSRLHPNEALDWFTIQWVKRNGYKYYDLEGIERPAAQAIVAGQPLPEEFSQSPTTYKLRLGGQVVLNPGCYCFVANPVFRSLYNRVGFQIANWPFIQKAAGRFRTG